MPLYLHFWTFLVFSLTKAVLCSAKCPDTTKMIIAEGSDVTMPINKDSVKEVIWVFKHRYIAKTWANRISEISDPAYKGRMDIKPGLSIMIKNVTEEDEGLYTANVLRENTEDYEQLCYELKVYEKLSAKDLQIHHRITDSKNCHLNLSCTVNIADVTVSWNSIGRGDTNVANITFLGNSPDTDSSYTCIAANPASSVSRTIIPRLVCAEEMNPNSGVRHKNQHTGLIPVIAILLTLVLFLEV
ncbi:SLAM family member 9 isoform X2 [Xenopus laevis]|uniref:SLAM family member 9 isoform X2 n=1 Tax=Xenopus laevis TaxID=8355 RepID=A0A8J0TMU9_XENLA|nr:SLAM family member 9 isoform X2 [Xenopus laevis]